MLDKESATPLYMQVRQKILDKIENGLYQPSGKLPSEKELAQLYQVSLITVRRAVSELEEQQLLKRKQGKGTYITRQQFSRSFADSALSFTEICRANGMQASARLLRCEILTDPDETVRKQLLLPEGSKAIRIERLRLADRIPIVIETACFSMEFSFLLEADLEKRSMYEVIRENRVVDLRPVVGKRTLQIVKADRKTANLLGIRESTPLLCYKGLCWDSVSDRPVHTSFHVGYGEQMDFAFRF